MQVAALQGDFVTPTVMGAGESDAAREQRGARALFRMLADDAEHGAENKRDDAGLAGRSGRRVRIDGRAHAAADLVAALREGRRASRTRWSARAALRETCSRDIGLETPKEVKA